jgi:hypothetical protein
VSDPVDAAPLTRGIVLLLGVFWTQRNAEGPLGTIDTIASCLVGEKSHQPARSWWLAWSLFSLVAYLAGLVGVGGIAFALARALRRTRAASGQGASVLEGGPPPARGKETLAAVLPVVGALALVVAVVSLDRLGFWDWAEGAGGEFFFQHPGTAMFWVAFAVPALGMASAVTLAVVAVKPVLVRLRPDRAPAAGLAVEDSQAPRARRG